MLFNFFKKKARFLGRGGLEFKYQKNDYVIDSEFSLSEMIDIVIYKDSVLSKNGKKINEILKQEVLFNLIDYLENEEHLKVHIM